MSESALENVITYYEAVHSFTDRSGKIDYASRKTGEDARKEYAELLQARQDNATLAERLKAARDDAERLYIANDGMRGLSNVIEQRCKQHAALVAQEAGK